MEHKIGEIFEYNGVKLKVEKSIIGCRDCHFLHVTYCENNSNCEACNYLERKDQTNVIFVKVKDNTNNNKDMETRNIKLDLKTAKEWFKGGDETLKKLALQAYKEEELKDNLPKTWEDFCKTHQVVKTEYCIDNFSDIVSNAPIHIRRERSHRNLLPSKASAEAHLALMQLEQLRDCYRGGWVPDWDNYKENKYVIFNYNDKVKTIVSLGRSSFLSFPSEQLRDKFLNNFKELIETAKDLI